MFAGCKVFSVHFRKRGVRPPPKLQNPHAVKLWRARLLLQRNFFRAILFFLAVGHLGV